MTSYRTDKTSRIILAIFMAYMLAYAYARSEVFHAVERYIGGKGGFRQDYITKKDQAPGEGWEYKLFFPAIKLEETIRSLNNYF
ncbi:MAG: hypothetical protein HC800_19910 [Phormidesmis sp. RL_2_1]|nr:hypothetical protein [Phormidesmis sp. RL_2_1]